MCFSTKGKVTSFAAPYDVKLSPPSVLLSSHLVITPPLITDTVFWLVVVYVVIFWDRIRSRSVLFHFIFHKTNRRPKQWPLSSPNFPPRPNLVPNTILIACTVFGWLLFKVVARGGRLRPTPGPFLSLFLVAPFAAQNDRKKFSPRVPPRLHLIESPPPPPQPTSGWLLCLLTKRRPPKVAAPPISQFFDGCPFGAQNKGKESGENEPRPLAPAQDSWGGAAP